MSFIRKFINDEVDFIVFFCVFCYKDWFFIIKYLIMIDFFMFCFILSVICCICNRLNLCWIFDIGRW